MLDPSLQPGTTRSASVAGVGVPSGIPSGTPNDGASALRGARFQALLEQLDLRAKEMAKSAQEPLSAETLPSAVENARSSMQDALELSKSLLEAFRQSAAQSTQSKS